MPSPNEIKISQLSRLVGTPDSPVIIDLRIDEDFAEDPRLIPQSFRYPFQNIAALAPSLHNQHVVVSCHKGKKISQGTAAILRDHGVRTESLEGGFLGWKEANNPLVPIDKIPDRNIDGRTVWVTRLRPKIDRLACPWLIRRFIDRNAQILYVTASEVLDVAEKFNATPFDVEDVYWSHRGQKCTFDTMIEEFCLEIESLKRLATIVRGADTNRHDLAPEAAGLLAASLGLSRMYRDDLQQLDAGMALYDAFYRWARDATDESHDWPAPNSQRPSKGD
ncbi:chromate resistance protein ChrB domain-containing protein [Kiloniella majae]|uniref:chromate resistance protein ChrB domain-containing protein n=1 Tax=Kiloniella majae TaxID=1938558 RepID=UPI000A27839F|nr:sulfurtransferase/chromate resistance protein [Kiloniella majae]